VSILKGFFFVTLALVKQPARHHCTIGGIVFANIQVSQIHLIGLLWIGGHYLSPPVNLQFTLLAK
jgi:hypothetical protein